MSVNQICSLCCTTCIEYNSLQTDLEEFNEIYNITVKYFDPMLFTPDESTNSDYHPVLCQECWFHIKEFHEFQQQVLKTRIIWEDNSHLKTLLIDVKQEIIEENVLTSNTPDNGSLDKSEVDKDNLFENNLEYRDLKTESFTNSENTFQSILKQEVIQANVPASNASDNGIFDNSEDDDDNLFEYNLDYGDLKTESPTSCEDTLKTTPKQTDKKDEENNLAIEKDLDKDENKLTTNRKLRQLPKRINKEDAKPESVKQAKLTEHTTTTRRSTKFNMEKARESNALIAKWKPEWLCDLCNETVTNYDNMRSHFKEKHKSRFYIKCCERKFYRRCVLVNHIQLHLNPETHKCDICGKSSKTQEGLKLHKKMMHEATKKLKCNICEKLFKMKNTLERHLLTHSTNSKDFICSECGKGYLTEQLLKYHVKHVHNGDRVCDQCGKTIHGSQALKNHLMEHAGIERRKFPCDVCGNELKTATNLKRHKSIYHSDGSTIYVCSVCGKVAASENALLNHKRLVHETERTHKCTHCDKAFKRQNALREHIATHTGEDLYQCPHCPRRFKVSGNMHHHRKRKHRVEWEASRRHRLQYPKINDNQVKKKIAIY